MREVLTSGTLGSDVPLGSDRTLSSLWVVSPHEAAHQGLADQLAAEERQRRREAVLHNLQLARARRRRRPLARLA